jgi:tetratricopeptide (TPR) repeat protein
MKERNMRKLLTFSTGILVATFLFQAEPGNAYEALKPMEKAMLPKECQRCNDPTCGDFHHYCAGLISLHRAETSFGGKRQGHAKAATGILNYTIGSMVRKNHPLLPEVHTNRAIAFSMLDEYGEALTEANKALEIDPGYEQAYKVLINIYKKLNKNDEALKIASNGLTRIPDSKVLRKEYLELGGKEPFPEPVASVSRQPATELAPAAPEEKQPADSVAVSGAESGTEAGAGPSSPAAAAPGDAESKPRNNPWCRFCP